MEHVPTQNGTTTHAEISVLVGVPRSRCCLVVINSMLTMNVDDPVNENDGSLRSCGDGRWCCEPSAIAGTCDCETGDGTFSLRNGTAQTIIGIEGLEYTSTEVIPTATSSALSKSATAAASTTTVAAASSVSAVPSAPLSSTATSRATLTSSAIIPATALASRESRASTYMTTRLTTSSSTSTVNSSLRSETPTGQASANKGGKLSTPSIAIISAIAGVVGTALAGMILYFCRKRRAKRRKREREQQANRNSRHSDSDIQLQPNAPAITPITFPDPYDPTSTPFFGQRNADQRRTSRSGINLTMRPDHDPQRDSQPNLTRTPPMDPYNRPQSGSNTQMPRHTSSFSIHEERTTTPSSFHSVRNPYSPGPPPRYESVPDRTSTTRISNIPRGDTVRTAQRAPPMPHPRRPVINNTASR